MKLHVEDIKKIKELIEKEFESMKSSMKDSNFEDYETMIKKLKYCQDIISSYKNYLEDLLEEKKS